MRHSKEIILLNKMVEAAMRDETIAIYAFDRASYDRLSALLVDACEPLGLSPVIHPYVKPGGLSGYGTSLMFLDEVDPHK